MSKNNNRHLLTELNTEEQTLRQQNSPTYAEWMRVHFSKSIGIHQQMKIDMETLFIFGNLLLEQWTYVILSLIGEEVTKETDFAKLMTRLQKKGDHGLLQPLWDKHHQDMLWLLYQIRNYRNIFVEHPRSPTQRGTSMFTFGDDFRLTSSALPDWISQDEIEKTVKKIRYLAPKWAKSPEIEWYTRHPRQLLEIIFYYIDEIEEPAQREEVWTAWKKIGGLTFSYDMIAFRLMRFLAESMLTMLDVITQHPDKINVGAAQTSQT